LTRKRLKEFYSLRKELALTERRLEACGENPQQMQRLREKVSELQAEVSAVEDFVESLESSILRQIITLRYIEGMTIEETGKYVGYGVSSVKKYCEKLFPDE